MLYRSTNSCQIIITYYMKYCTTFFNQRLYNLGKFIFMKLTKNTSNYRIWLRIYTIDHLLDSAAVAAFY